MENCIVFDDKADLVNKIKDVLNMGQEEISKLRERVVDYYESHLTPEKFVSNIESREKYIIIAVMITEKYVKDNALKLNEKSIIIGNDSALQSSIWFKILRTFKIGAFLYRWK